MDAGWDPLGSVATTMPAAGGSPSEELAIVELTDEVLARVRLADRVVAIASAAEGLAALARLIAGSALGVGALSGGRLVGVAAAGPSALAGSVELLAVGVAPAWRRRGLGSALLDRLVTLPDVRGRALEAIVGPAERDILDPWPFQERIAAARRLLGNAGFDEDRGDPRSLPSTIRFVRPAG
jgi:GNAT superfamily N-acetyltransferase